MSAFSTAVVMAGAGLHGRMLIREMVERKVPPSLIINEAGTKRAERLATWLDNDIDRPLPVCDLIKETETQYIEVDRFDGSDAMEAIARLRPHYLVMGGAGIVKDPLLSAAAGGMINAHPGLLPEYRGLDPVLWSVWNNCPVGATLHVISEGIDEGPILMRRALEAIEVSSILELRLRCMRLGASLLAEFLLDPKKHPPKRQNESRAQYFGAFPEANRAELEKRLANYSAFPADGALHRPRR